jgi:hypothetical protein
MIDYSKQPLTRLDGNGNPQQQQSPQKAREVEIFDQIGRQLLAILHLLAELRQPPQKARDVEIFTKIGRHLLAILYLLAELRLGYKPEKLKVKE